VTRSSCSQPPPLKSGVDDRSAFLSMFLPSYLIEGDAEAGVIHAAYVYILGYFRPKAVDHVLPSDGSSG